MEQELSADPLWYLLRTKRHCERRAKLHLESKGLEAYLPLMLQWPPPAVGSATAERVRDDGSGAVRRAVEWLEQL